MGYRAVPLILGTLLLVAMLCTAAAAGEKGESHELPSAVLWRSATPERVRSEPTLSGDMVYGGSDGGVLYAFERSTGKVRWKFPAYAATRGKPAVGYGSVFFGAFNGVAYALDAETGWLRWQHQAPSWIPAGPVIGNGLVYVISYDGNLRALDAESGGLVWTFNAAPEFTLSAPLVVGRGLYLNTVEGSIYGIDAITGTRLWKREGMGKSVLPPVRGGDLVVVAAAGAGGSSLGAYHRHTGVRVWLAGYPGVENWHDMAADGELVVAAGDGAVYAVAGSSGTLLWSRDLAGVGQVSSVRLYGGHVVAVSSPAGPGRSRVHMLDSRTGRYLWGQDLPTRAVSRISISGGMGFFGGEDYYTYALAPVRVILNSAPVAFRDIPAFLEDGRVMVPLRPVLEAVGYSVFWDEEQRSVTAGRLRLDLERGSGYVDDKLWVPTPRLKLLSGQTVVPLRPLVEAFGGRIVWSGPELTAYVTLNRE